MMRMRRERKRSREEGKGRNKREGETSGGEILSGTFSGYCRRGNAVRTRRVFAAGHGYLRHQGTQVFLPEARYPQGP
jgi:hypothetical protein